MEYYQKEYKKYREEYLRKKQSGGADESTDESVDSDTKSDTEGKRRERGKFIVQIKSIHVEQNEKEHKFKGVMTKTPPIKMSFHEKEIKMATLVKAALRFVNKNMRMKFVKEVEISKGKNKDKMKGDKLEGTVDLEDEPVYDEIKIIYS